MKPAILKTLGCAAVVMVVGWLAVDVVRAEEQPAKAEAAASGGTSADALAIAAQNPLAKMISVPFQNNFNCGLGPEHVTQWICDVQPVIPISLNDDWNLITRTIIPVINQPSPAHGVPSAFGVGDINPSFFFSPANPGKLTWGVGPTLTLPTATDSLLGSGKWSAGPAAILMYIQKPWVIGAIVNNQWSFAGWGDHSVNAMLVQPILNYNLGQGWYLVSSPILTAAWKAKGSDVWTVPIGGGVGRVFKIGSQALNVQLAAYDNVHTPQNGADWQLRFQVVFLFPK